MRGSLDQPPIVIYEARLWRWGISLVVALFLLVLSMGLLGVSAIGATIALTVCAVFAAGSFLSLVDPMRLVIRPQGITTKGYHHGRHTRRWDRTQNFRVGAKGQVACDAGNPPHEVLIGERWEIAPDKVVELLSAGRQRWGGIPNSAPEESDSGSLNQLLLVATTLGLVALLFWAVGS
ncbi:MAG TPA: hypothetical protein VHX61_17795 [Rhizomicrobium sp.]|jgi:hypothetical protein|nr:hypothetical protein [Rhizomicrobium sp.]